jgi:hypothetical protein
MKRELGKKLHTTVEASGTTSGRLTESFKGGTRSTTKSVGRGLTSTSAEMTVQGDAVGQTITREGSKVGERTVTKSTTGSAEAGGAASRVGSGKLAAIRRIVLRSDPVDGKVGLVATDRVERRGILARITRGRVGRRTTIETAQTADGERTTLSTGRSEMTSETRFLRDGRGAVRESISGTAVTRGGKLRTEEFATVAGNGKSARIERNDFRGDGAPDQVGTRKRTMTRDERANGDVAETTRRFGREGSRQDRAWLTTTRVTKAPSTKGGKPIPGKPTLTRQLAVTVAGRRVQVPTGRFFVPKGLPRVTTVARPAPTAADAPKTEAAITPTPAPDPSEGVAASASVAGD